MFRNFIKNATKTVFDNPQLFNRRQYDAATRYVTNPSAAAVQEAKDAGVRTDHAVIVDKQKPNKDGTLPVKAQITHGKGDSSNPSKVLSEQGDFQGKNREQRIVVPEKPLNVHPSDLQPNHMPHSDTLLDTKSVKDNLHKAGVTPSDYKSGDPYQP